MYAIFNYLYPDTLYLIITIPEPPAEAVSPPAPPPPPPPVLAVAAVAGSLD
jgi:hypothetical protein